MENNEIIAQTLRDLQECLTQAPYLLAALAGAIDAEKRTPLFIPSFDERAGVQQ